jgi:DNA-binding MarR family transcriptional regulator
MKAVRDLGGLELDRLIHEKSRLMILAFLSSRAEPETGFTELRDELSLSAGNLSVQLKNLEEAGYLQTEKSFRDNKPYTGVRLTSRGRRALDCYLADLEVVVASLKGSADGANANEKAGGGATIAPPSRESMADAKPAEE